MTDPCELLGVYVVDAVSDEERTEFADHLVGCDRCLAEIGGLADTAASLAATTAVVPPMSLRARVLAEIDRTPQLGPLEPAATGPAAANATSTHSNSVAQPDGVIHLDQHRRTGRRAALRWTLAAAAVGLVGAGAIGTITGWRAAGERADAMAEQKDLLAAPDAKLVPVQLRDGGQGSYLLSKVQNRALFLPESLPALPAGRVFQQWTVVDGRPAPDVTFTSTAESVWLTGDVAAAEALAISVESSSVPATQPTADAVMVLAKI